MKQLLIWTLLTALDMGQGADRAEVQLQAAIKKESFDGHLKGAILAGVATGVRFGSRRNTIERFGKATEDFKLWLPSPLHAELAGLAKQDGMGVSDYLRKTLVRILLGERTYLDWQRAIGAIPDEWRLSRLAGGDRRHL